jgi:uncharacterized protein DUF3379
MNCIEARRRVLVQPRRCQADVTSHLRACRVCSAFAERAANLEQRMCDAIVVPIPRDLSSHVVESVLAGYRRQRRRFVTFAAAASTVVFSGGLTAVLTHDDPEALAGIDFVRDEEANAILSTGPSDPAALRRVLDVLGIRLPAQLGQVRYIGTFPFMGTTAHHVIATTLYGKVTMLLMPDREVDGRKSAHARGLRALVCPVRHGCVTVVGESARSVARITEMVLGA